MATIDAITQIDGGFTYTFSATGQDIWLDGTLLEENYADTSYTLYTSKVTPPPIQITDYGTRCTNSWASRRMGIQFFVNGFDAFALTEYRSGVEYRTRYYDAPAGERYVTLYVLRATTDPTTQYWVVRPAIRYNKGEYAITGHPVEVITQRHYLPQPPVVTYTYDPTARTLTIS